MSVAVNLALLSVFKYADFVINSVNAVTGWQLAAANLPLPIGISFYTFQSMSYTIDVYRGQVPAQKNILDFGAYISLFPQLIAGPIITYSTVADQLNHRTHSADKFALGIRRFTVGLGKKVLLANNIGLVWSMLTAQGVQESVLGAWIAIVAYALQIYLDFSGYSDMAIGLGHMFGFTFVENFNYPYISRSITEFWRRWHISLGSWFRTYVYIPLGGNRHGKAKQLRNIAIVWLLTGLWHGASWNFVAWGAYYCALLLMEKLFLLKWMERWPKALCWAYTVLCVLIGWVLFAFDSSAQGLGFLGTLAGIGAVPASGSAVYMLVSNGPLLLFGALASTPLGAKIWQKVEEKGGSTAAGVLETVLTALILVVCTAYLVSGSSNPFLYFRF